MSGNIKIKQKGGANNTAFLNHLQDFFLLRFTMFFWIDEFTQGSMIEVNFILEDVIVKINNLNISKLQETMGANRVVFQENKRK